MSQNTFNGALKFSVICSGAASGFFLNRSLHPAMHSALNASRNSTERAQKNPNTDCRVLNSSPFMYFLFGFMAFRSCLSGVLIPAFLAGRGAPLSMSDEQFRDIGQSSLFWSSGAASAEETGFEFESTRAFSCGSKFEFLSTASVGQKTRRAWALLSYSSVFKPAGLNSLAVPSGASVGCLRPRRAALLRETEAARSAA